MHKSTLNIQFYMCILNYAHDETWSLAERKVGANFCDSLSDRTLRSHQKTENIIDMVREKKYKILKS